MCGECGFFHREQNGSAAGVRDHAWCSHYLSPVTKEESMSVIPGHRVLRCEGQLHKCYIAPNGPPKD